MNEMEESLQEAEKLVICTTYHTIMERRSEISKEYGLELNTGKTKIVIVCTAN